MSRINFFCVILHCLSVFAVVQSRKNYLKEIGIRKDRINHLSKSKTKLFDVILNRAVNEIIDSISSTRTGKRKRIESSVYHKNIKLQPLNLSEIPDNVRESLELASGRLKNTDSFVDPFNGQNDPYGNVSPKDDSSDTFDSVNDFLKSMKQKSIEQDLPNEDTLLNKYHNRHDKDDFKNPITVERTPYMINDTSEGVVKENLKEKSSYDEFRKKSENTKKANNKSKIDISVETNERASEMLPVDQENEYDIVVLKDEHNNDEVKLDEPNVHFDVTVNSANNRDKIVKDLKDVVHVLSNLKFGKDKTEILENNKSESVIVADKRGVTNVTSGSPSFFGNTTDVPTYPVNATTNNPAEVSNKSGYAITDNSPLPGSSNRLPEVIPELKSFMYPAHGTYFLQHEGNIYKLEKIDKIHDAIDDVKVANPSNDHDTLQEKSSGRNITNTETRLKQHELASDGEINEDDHRTTKTENKTYIIKHGGDTYEITQAEKAEAEEKQPSLREDAQEIADNSDTYEIKHNNKTFRVTEIIPKTKFVSNTKQDELAPNTRSVSLPNSSSFTSDRGTVSSSNSESLQPELISGEQNFIRNNALDMSSNDLKTQPRFEEEANKGNEQFKNQKSSDSDDDYVTYVFRTKNNTLTDQYADSLNNTLLEEVTP